jgi:DNA polymerase-4
VTLKLKHADFRLVTRRAGLEAPSQDTGQIYRAALALLQAHAHPGPFRLIGVGVGDLVPEEAVGGGLFDQADLARARALTRAELSIRDRHGDQALTRAGTLPLLVKGPAKGDNEPGPQGGPGERNP